MLCVVPAKWRRMGSLLISNLNENLESEMHASLLTFMIKMYNLH